MQIGQVKGSLWATRKDEHLNGLKFLIVEITEPMSKTVTSLVAADIIGAGLGDQVLVATGSAARMAVEDTATPIDAAVICIIDSVELENEN